MGARLLRCSVIASLFLALGGHLPVLQAFAWTRMVMARTPVMGLEPALQRTFDGQHPCPLCLRIKIATQEGPSLGVFRTEHPLDIACLKSAPWIKNFDAIYALISLSLIGYDHNGSPDSPPPKKLLA